MKWLGSYRSTRVDVERKPGELVDYRGNRAMVRFHDGQTYAVPAQPLKGLQLQPQERFALLIHRVGGEIVDVRAERLAERRPARPKRGTPKIMVKKGGKLVTRDRR